MKKYILSAVAVLSATTLFTSCNDSLDTDPRVTQLTAATFPGKPGDVEALNAATYSIMNTLGGGDQSGICNNPFYCFPNSPHPSASLTPVSVPLRSALNARPRDEQRPSLLLLLIHRIPEPHALQK